MSCSLASNTAASCSKRERHVRPLPNAAATWAPLVPVQPSRRSTNARRVVSAGSIVPRISLNWSASCQCGDGLRVNAGSACSAISIAASDQDEIVVVFVEIRPERDDYAGADGIARG